MNQAEREREIFEAFTAVAPFKVLPGSIENRSPPEPDILCQIEGRGKVGFELTELIDQAYMARIGLMFKTRKYLNSYWQNELDTRDSALFLSKYSDTLLHFDYSQTSSLNERKVAAKIAFQKLLHLPDNCDGEFLNSDPELATALQWVQIRRVGIAQPIIDVGSYGSQGDPTTQAIKNKFSKNYKCNYPIELLAHINWGIMPHEEVWKNSAKNAASQISNSPFRKVWVFDMTDKKIKFEFEKSS
jgi:hypothetical protein